MQTMRQCLVCGADFALNVTNARIGQSIYCSKRCYGQASRKNISLTCQHCGIQFLRWPSKAAERTVHYCSRRCYNASVGPETLMARFLEKVDKTATCWIWRGAIESKGYGRVTVRYRNLGAHVLSWMLHHGPIPDGLQVLHNCPDGDNPSCVNPDHLWLGTQTENIRDMFVKGRGHDRRGTMHPKARLTEQQVHAIRAQYAAGNTSLYKLAAKYQVSPSTIAGIAYRRTWKHI